ncbi:MAG TPA: CorA family divalent cation transporter [Polyangiaceae bacterium]|nr:CorA family divalent cation transporter [Polyangiaceae bacterium]
MATGDDSGLICGFRLSRPAPLGDALPSGPAQGDPLWVHVNLTDTRARAWLAQRRELPEEARELLLGTDARVHVEVLDEGIVAVLGDLYHDFDLDPERLGTLRLYLDSHWLLTGRTHPLRAVDMLRRELSRGSDPLSAVASFQALIERLAEAVARVAAQLAQQVDDTEDRILEGEFAGQSKPLGNLRRLVAKLRRLASANRAALGSLPPTLAGLYDEEEGAQLRSAIERFDAVGQDLELVQERARLLQEEIASHMNEATNRNLFVLSIATTTLLPITLITGIFGMNVRGLPFAEHPHGFHVVMLGIAFTVVLALWLLRRVGAL